MSLFRDIGAELYKMFLGDLRLSLGVLAVACLAALVAEALPGERMLAAGGVLLIGCLAVFVAAVIAAARRG